MRDVCTSHVHPVSRRELCHVSENEGFNELADLVGREAKSTGGRGQALTQAGIQQMSGAQIA